MSPCLPARSGQVISSSLPSTPCRRIHLVKSLISFVRSRGKGQGRSAVLLRPQALQIPSSVQLLQQSVDSGEYTNIVAVGKIERIQKRARFESTKSPLAEQDADVTRYQTPNSENLKQNRVACTIYGRFQPKSSEQTSQKFEICIEIIIAWQGPSCRRKYQVWCVRYRRARDLATLQNKTLLVPLAAGARQKSSTGSVLEHLADTLVGLG